nr:tyrosine-type recombinase/integrase [Methylorubrum extorquens]
MRTKEPREARLRHSIADGALKRFWQGQRIEAPFNSDRHDLAADREGHFPAPVLRTVAYRTEAESDVEASLRKTESVSAYDLFDKWAAYSTDKRAANTLKRYRSSFRSLAAFVGERDVRSLTSDDLFAWAEWRRDHDGVSARAINKNDLVAASSIFRWAAGRSGKQLISSNPAAGVSLDEPRIAAERARTFREEEIAAILRAASTIENDAENPTRSNARRWCPWLAAYSGARIAELTSLEKRDIRNEAGIVVVDLRVTKAGELRTIPLHGHLIEQGFLNFVKTSQSETLFYDQARHRKNAETSPAEQQAKALATWVRATVRLDPRVDPNHGWRHTWKTRALGAGIEERLRDAITGHRVASVGRRYETPSLDMLSAAMKRFPRYDV